MLSLVAVIDHHFSTIYKCKWSKDPTHWQGMTLVGLSMLKALSGEAVFDGMKEKGKEIRDPICRVR